MRRTLPCCSPQLIRQPLGFETWDFFPEIRQRPDSENVHFQERNALFVAIENDIRFVEGGGYVLR